MPKQTCQNSVVETTCGILVPFLPKCLENEACIIAIGVGVLFYPAGGNRKRAQKCRQVRRSEMAKNAPERRTGGMRKTNNALRPCMCACKRGDIDLMSSLASTRPGCAERLPSGNRSCTQITRMLTEFPAPVSLLLSGVKRVFFNFALFRNSSVVLFFSAHIQR